MTIEEFFTALEESPEAERQALSTKLLKELSVDDRALVESVLADALESMSNETEIIKAPPGFSFD
jgi:hypothetical protein